MPMEYILPSLRIAQITGMVDTDTVQERLAQLLALEEDRFHRQIPSESAEGTRKILARQAH